MHSDGWYSSKFGERVRLNVDPSGRSKVRYSERGGGSFGHAPSYRVDGWEVAPLLHQDGTFSHPTTGEQYQPIVSANGAMSKAL